MPQIPVVAPLEALVQPVDGMLATSANFGTPVHDFAQSLIGESAGDPDTNQAHPIVARTHQNGMLSYTNYVGVPWNGGQQVNAASWFIHTQFTSAASYTVPFGYQLVVTNICTFSLNLYINQFVNVTTNTDTVNLWSGGYGSGSNSPQILTAAYMPFPLVIDQQWTVTFPYGYLASGYYVVRDAAVTPVCENINNIAAGQPTSKLYTVPDGSTLWLYGALLANPGAASGAPTDYGSVVAGNTPVIATIQDVLVFTPGAAETMSMGYQLGTANAMAGPIPISAGTVLSSFNTSPINFWGVLI